MDFLDPKKQRARTIQLFVGYGLVAIAIIVATIILLYRAYGFGLDRNGQLIQSGLVYFSSQPGNADIYIDGKTDSTTNSRRNIPAGDYDIAFKKDGYRDWSRRITVEGGQVVRYDYPLLVPTNLQTSSKQTFSKTPLLATESPSRRWLLVATAPNGTDAGLRFTQYDLNNPDDAATTFTLPNTIAPADSATSGWSVAEWSNDNRHVMLKKDNVYYMVDRQEPDQSFNVNARLSVTDVDVRLQDKKFDRYFVLNGANQLLSQATADQPILQTVAEGVLQYDSYGNDILVYATTVGAAEGKARIQLLQDNQTVTLRSVPASDQYLLDLTRYEDQWLVAVGASSENRVYVYTNPLDTLTAKPIQVLTPVATLRVNNPNYVEFSANTRFLAVTGGSSVGVYDAEYDDSYTYDLAAAPEGPAGSVRWMDGHRLTYVSGGTVRIVDFDNTNAQTLMAGDSRFRTMFDDNYNFVYNLTTSGDGRSTLQSTPLLTAEDL